MGTYQISSCRLSNLWRLHRMVGAYRCYATAEFNWAAHQIPVRLFMRSLSSRPLPRRITRRGQVRVHA